MQRFDVAILGGGPAGAAAALALHRHAPGLTVALVERSDGQLPRVGETLPPGVQPLLEHLGVWEPFQHAAHLPAYGTRSGWGTTDLFDNDFLFAARGDGWHLDRARFDAMMREASQQAGVRVWQNARVATARRTRQAWELWVDGEGGRTQLKAGFVVDATGRSAWFARRFGGAAPIHFDHLVGLFRFFHRSAEDPLADCATLIEPSRDGYWYAALVPNDKIAVAFLTDADIAHRQKLKQTFNWSAALDATSHCGKFLRQATPVTETLVRDASSQQLDRVCDGDWLAVGDAASTFDPLSSQGIFKALRSGIYAAYAIADQLRGKGEGLRRYQHFVHRQYDQYLETRDEYYAQERRWPDAPFWMRRDGHISLDPLSKLFVSPRNDGQVPRATQYLASGDFHALRELCRVPRQACQVVSAFKQCRPAAASDQRIILALQYMIESGLVSTAKIGVPVGQGSS